MTTNTDDVPSPIDFHNSEHAKRWIEETAHKRPWRPEFFNLYVEALNEKFDHPIAMLELGSGPGLLAEQILRHCTVRSFDALDFSAAMLSLAYSRLEPLLERIRFVQRDFRLSEWVKGLGPYDAIVSMQAVHEVRHKRRIPALLDQVYGLLEENGLFLFCDHYLEPENPNKNVNLYLTQEEQKDALADAGFADIRCLLDKGGMTLWSATKVR